MTRQPVLAIVADTIEGARPGDDGSAQVQRAALAVQRAALLRGGRVLLSADGVALVPLLLAAAEFQMPRRVEGDERPAAALIVTPFPGGDSLEDRLLGFREERREGISPLSLLEQLVSVGLADLRQGSESNSDDPGRVFSSALGELKVSAVFAIGGDQRIQPMLRAAEVYWRASRRRVHLVHLLHPQGERGRWPDLSERVGAFSRVPPVFEGESLHEQARDERLIALGLRAAAEAALSLAIDRAVEEAIAEEPEAGGEPSLVQV